MEIVRRSYEINSIQFSHNQMKVSLYENSLLPIVMNNGLIEVELEDRIAHISDVFEVMRGCPKWTLFIRQGANNLTFDQWTSITSCVRATGDVRQHALPILHVYG